MTNLAREARVKAQAKWPGATVHNRGKNWIAQQHPTESKRFILDTHIGPIHYGPVEELEIDTAWEPSTTQPWLHQMIKADFNVFMGPGTTEFDAGQIVRYVHPDSGEDVTFQAQQLQWTNDLDQIEAIADPQTVGHTSIDDDTIFWEGAYGPGLDFRWQAQTARLAKYLTIHSLSAIGAPPQFIIDGGNPVFRLGFIFQKSHDIDIYIDGVLWNEKSNNPQTTSGSVEFRLSATGESLWWFTQASAEDGSEDVDAPVLTQQLRAVAQNLLVEILVPWAWLEAAVYPVEIDPTIDDQVAATADDGYTSASTTWAGSSTTTRMGAGASYQYDSYHRFTSISGLAGSTIDTSYVSFYSAGVYSNAILNKIHAEDAAAPTQVTSVSDYDGRTLTSAAIDWDPGNWSNNSWVNSPSINSVIQELADSYDPSVISVFVLDDGTASNVYRRFDAYLGSSTLCAKLHIEYTTGGAAYPMPEALQSYRQRRT